MSQPMPFPRPRSRSEDLSAHNPDDLPKRVPGATLRSVRRVPAAGHPRPGEAPPLTWHRYPPEPRYGLVARVVRALRRWLPPFADAD